MLDDDPLAQLIRQVSPPWVLDAACREHPELSWFPGVGEDQSRQRAICSACLVRADCLVAGAGEHGIWGGQSERARNRRRIDLVAA